MASKQLLAILAIIVVTLPALAQAMEYVVGDGYGWRLNFDYDTWAKGKDFRVGDTLVFKYQVGYHNVYKVNGSDFVACSVPLANVPLTSGNDVITFATPGRKWYICGKNSGKHCMMGQKLVITVQSASWQAPSPSPSPSVPSWSIPTLAQATVHVVGDDFGWGLNFDYVAWAKDKVFRVGDTLVFKYQVGYHNVYKVNGSDFLACSVPLANVPLTSGNDVITLATPGRKWYICGKNSGKHCMMGQKLVITVQSASLQAPSPSPSLPTWSDPALAPTSSPHAAPAPHHWFGNRFLKH